MDLKNLFEKKYIVGLDVGSSSVKLAQFVKKEDGLHLIKTALENIRHTPDGALHEQTAITAVKNLLKGIDIKKSRFVASINCPDTAIRKITAPYMPKAELQQAILLAVKNYFSFPVERALLDFQISGEITEKGIRKYKLIVAISQKDTINKILSILSRAGIKPVSLIPSGYALQKIATHVSGSAAGVNCFVDIGSKHTELIILKAGELVFSRKIPVSGDDFTKAMTAVLVSDSGRTELSPDEAQRIKEEIGIPKENEQRIVANKVSTRQISSMLQQPLEQFANEIERSFDYYKEESGTDKIDSLVLCGGGGLLKGLAQFLSKELEIPVKLGDALDGRISGRLELAAAAALSETGDVNLLPPEIKDETKRAVRAATLKATVAAIVVIAALIYTGMKLQLVNFQKRIAVSELELKSLQPQLKSAEVYALASGLLAGEPFWDDVFKELSNIAPDNVCITELAAENRTIRIKYNVVSGEPQKAISNFTQALEKGIFKNVGLKQSLSNEFELSCWLK